MSDREPVLRDCFKVKKGLCVTGDAYITGNLTLSGDFAWLNPDALLTVGNLETINLSAGRLYSSNDELVVVPFGPDYTILHPLSVVDETVFESAVQMETDLWVKGNLRVDGNAYLSAGIDGVINVGDTNTDNVVFNADIQSSLIPNTTDTYDLGSVDQHWDTLYVHDISAHGSVDIEDSLSVSGTTTLSGALSAGSDATLSSNLTVSANTTIGGTTTLSGALSAGSDVEIAGILDVELDATLSSNLTVSANTTIGGNTTLSGTFSAAGDSKIDSDLHVVGDLRVDGDVWFNANNTNGTNTINLGDDNTDNVVFNADVDSDIIPDKTMTYDLGSANQHWSTLYVHDVSAHGSVSASDLFVTGSAALSSLSLSGASTTPMLRVAQLGTGNALEILDQSDPDNTPFIINSSGRVGIGKAIPVYPLDVQGFVNIRAASSGTQPPVFQIENTGSNTALAVSGGLTVVGDISASGDIYAANHSLIFSDGDPSNDTTWSKNDSITAKRVAGEWDGIHDDGSLTIPVSVSVAGDFVADGDVTLGQPNTTIMLGKLGSDLIPTQHDVFSIGSGNNRFLTGHFSDLNVDVGVDTHSLSTEMVYFTDPDDDDQGLSPTSPVVYDEERNLTYTEILSSRDTTSVVQANSADWANHAPTERIQVLTRSALNLTFNSGNGTNDIFKEFITIATDNPVGDARWDDITYAHAMVLPYNTVVKKIILRGTATQSATVNIGVHTNNGVTDTNTIEYKYFTETPTATAENTFQINNEPKVFTFADTTSALEGSTLGISISGTKVISAVNLSIVLAYSD